MAPRQIRRRRIHLGDNRARLVGPRSHTVCLARVSDQQLFGFHKLMTNGKVNLVNLIGQSKNPRETARAHTGSGPSTSSRNHRKRAEQTAGANGARGEGREKLRVRAAVIDRDTDRSAGPPRGKLWRGSRCGSCAPREAARGSLMG